MNEYFILLPVRCYTCGYVLGKFQIEYESLIDSGDLSFENIIKLFNDESTDVEIIYEKRLRSKLFKIPMIRDCCLTNLLSPIILPEQIKPKYPNPLEPGKMIESRSVGREVASSIPGEGRAKTKFYTKTFSDISSKRKLPREEEIGLVSSDVIDGSIPPSQGLVPIPTPPIASPMTASPMMILPSPSPMMIPSMPSELSPLVTPRQPSKIPTMAPMPPRLTPNPRNTSIKQLVPYRGPPSPIALLPMTPPKYVPSPPIRVDMSSLTSLIKK